MITDNLRRLAGVNAAAEGGKWEPAAEILSVLREGSLGAISVSEHLICNQTLQRFFKEREADTSQLNRLGVAYFHLVYFRFQPHLTSAFRRRTVISLASQSFSF
jgi:hypothetical protein